MIHQSQEKSEARSGSASPKAVGGETASPETAHPNAAITIREAAAIYNYHPRHLQKWLIAGKLSGFKDRHGRWKIKHRTMKALVRRRAEREAAQS